MKNQTTKLAFALVSIFTLTLVFAFTVPQQEEGGPWEIPAKYKNMENPYADDESLVSVGKSIFSKHCASCHGKKGLGDGTKSATLKTYPGDFSDEEFQEHADGELYYMSFVGRDEMPNFEKKILDDEDRWAVINFIRTL